MPSRVRCSHSPASPALTRRAHHAHARAHAHVRFFPDALHVASRRSHGLRARRARGHLHRVQAPEARRRLPQGVDGGAHQVTEGHAGLALRRARRRLGRDVRQIGDRCRWHRGPGPARQRTARGVGSAGADGAPAAHAHVLVRRATHAQRRRRTRERARARRPPSSTTQDGGSSHRAGSHRAGGGLPERPPADSFRHTARVAGGRARRRGRAAPLRSKASVRVGGGETSACATRGCAPCPWKGADASSRVRASPTRWASCVRAGKGVLGVLRHTPAPTQGGTCACVCARVRPLARCSRARAPARCHAGRPSSHGRLGPQTLLFGRERRGALTKLRCGWGRGRCRAPRAVRTRCVPMCPHF